MPSYRVTNNTIKPERIKDGLDIRSMAEKVGFTVQWKDENNNLIVLHQNSNPKYMTKLTDSLVRLGEYGYVKIESSEKSLFDFMKEHTIPKEQSIPLVENKKELTEKNIEIKNDNGLKAEAILIGEITNETETKPDSSFTVIAKKDMINRSKDKK